MTILKVLSLRFFPDAKFLKYTHFSLLKMYLEDHQGTIFGSTAQGTVAELCGDLEVETSSWLEFSEPQSGTRNEAIRR